MKEKVLIILLLLSVLIFGLDRTTGVFSPVKNVVQIVTLPIQYSFYSVQQGIYDTFSFLTFWKSGEARIKNLEYRILTLESQKERADALQKENDQLRQQLGVTALRASKLLPAQVLGVAQRMEIAVGSNDGVKEGMSVVYLGNLVGRIETVFPRSSFVLLPSDANSKIPAKDNEVRGLVVGRFGSSMVLTQIGQTDAVDIGGSVLTSGEGDTYVANLIVGKIKSIGGGKTDLFREAAVESQIDFRKLTTVFVIVD